MNYITVDIETIPGSDENPYKPEDMAPPGNLKKAETIEKWYADEAAAACEARWRAEALHPLKGRVLCIGWAVNHDEPKSVIWAGPGDEAAIMKSFAALAEEFGPRVTWIGHNACDFDLVWLRLRALKYGLFELADYINLDRYHGNHFDTMQRLGAWGSKYSLKDSCAFFGINAKACGTSGADVFDMWRAGKTNEIAAYCRQDVHDARELAKRLGVFE